MNRRDLETIIKKACNQLYRHEKTLIDNETHEQTIVAHLLCYLKPGFKNQGWDVDVEYNRENRSNPKKDSDGNPLRPDLIVHQRGPNGSNLVAIEVKGYWNPEPRHFDVDSLLRLDKKHHYIFLYCLELQADEYKLLKVK